MVSGFPSYESCPKEITLHILSQDSPQGEEPLEAGFGLGDYGFERIHVRNGQFA